ncbi:hypothetical protein VDG1235_1568 [Verrucomicrobiia bacterium DG1235]|nr:hypothetical protein VDG1235_1568 [Verrucomicrobiae bacterium DG1235]
MEKSDTQASKFLPIFHSHTTRELLNDFKPEPLVSPTHFSPLQTQTWCPGWDSNPHVLADSGF